MQTLYFYFLVCTQYSLWYRTRYCHVYRPLTASSYTNWSVHFAKIIYGTALSEGVIAAFLSAAFPSRAKFLILNKLSLFFTPSQWVQDGWTPQLGVSLLTSLAPLSRGRMSPSTSITLQAWTTKTCQGSTSVSLTGGQRTSIALRDMMVA